MSLLVVFLFFVDAFCFRCWGYKNSCGARWAGSFCSPLCFVETASSFDPDISLNIYTQVFLGFLGLVFFRPSGCGVFCFFLGLVSVFSVFRVFFLGPCVFPVFLAFFFSAFRLLCCAALLHLASFSFRLGKEHSPVLPAAMDLGPLRPCTGVFRVARLLLGVVPGTRRCTAGGVRVIHCDPLHDYHHCHLSPR